MTTARAPIPVSFFSIAVGLLAFANTWRVGVRLWHLPVQVGQTLSAAGLAVWAVLLVLYARKWMTRRADAIAELQHPLQSAFAALLPVSSLLAAITLMPYSREAAIAVFGVAVVAQLALGVWFNGRMWMGGRPPELVTPATYLPSVAQSFVAAAASVAFGWTQVAMLLFGVGVFEWIVLESMILQRASVGSPLPVALRPLLGVQLAPAVVGGGSYLSLTSGAPDLFAWMLLGYGLYQALLLLRLLPWIREQAFVPGYWAFSFGVAALPAMAMRMAERIGTGMIVQLSLVLFVAANVVFAFLVVDTLQLLARGKLLPTVAPAVPAKA